MPRPFSKWSYSIQSAMILAFSLITISVVSLAIYIATLFTLREIKGVSVDYTAQLVSQVNADIDRYVSYMEDVGEVVSKNATVLRWLEADAAMGAADRLVLDDSVNKQLSGIVNVRSDIANIGLFAPDGRVVFDVRSKALNRHADYESTDWYREAAARGGGTYTSTTHVQNVVAGQYQWVVTISRAITSRSGQVLGVLMVDLNYSLINNLCEEIDLGDRGYLFLADRDGNIIYHPQQQLIYSRIKTEDVDAVLHRNTQVAVDGPDGGKLYISNHSAVTGWTVVGVAYQDELLRVREDIIRFYLVIVLAFMLAAVLLSAAISAAISRPLRKLNTTMQGVQGSGELDTSVQVAAPREVAQLAGTFNAMMERLRQLMRQQKRDQEQKRRSELKALQAQINPHFLYNTLDSIIWMAESGNNEEVVEMTAALAQLLRASISEERELVPLQVEVAGVVNYLTIQQMRYKEKLHFKVEVAPEARDYLLPKLVLQPLVENAIYHGIRPRGTGGEIVLAARFEDDALVIEVRDDGVGMDSQSLDAVLTAEPRKESGGIGVKNVHERVQLIYGEGYGLSYTSSGATLMADTSRSGGGVGTVARLTLPAAGLTSRDTSMEDGQNESSLPPQGGDGT